MFFLEQLFKTFFQKALFHNCLLYLLVPKSPQCVRPRRSLPSLGRELSTKCSLLSSAYFYSTWAEQRGPLNEILSLTLAAKWLLQVKHSRCFSMNSMDSIVWYPGWGCKTEAKSLSQECVIKTTVKPQYILIHQIVIELLIWFVGIRHLEWIIGLNRSDTRLYSLQIRWKNRQPEAPKWHIVIRNKYVWGFWVASDSWF